MVIMAVTLAIGLPGSIGLWLIAPFYPPVIATAMLTLSSVVGALGAYQIAARWQKLGSWRVDVEGDGNAGAA
ncbi:hypothetical protein HORIV_32750 [Vreelandella olivaria]|uniref:Uncharacterized protein n=1 Tax=Vreelandella olivaria TaxID=390919 RepID=A0ABM7GJU6_9GAMM|nr:hypothetical protein HORIV_32750 [Halomonas olivaria]